MQILSYVYTPQSPFNPQRYTNNHIPHAASPCHTCLIRKHLPTCSSESYSSQLPNRDATSTTLPCMQLVDHILWGLKSSALLKGAVRELTEAGNASWQKPATCPPLEFQDGKTWCVLHHWHEFLDHVDCLYIWAWWCVLEPNHNMWCDLWQPVAL